jgi:hypothetical protein
MFKRIKTVNFTQYITKICIFYVKLTILAFIRIYAIKINYFCMYIYLCMWKKNKYTYLCNYACNKSSAKWQRSCSAGRKRSWIIYCWLVWCERKILFWLEIYDRLRPSEQATKLAGSLHPGGQDSKSNPDPTRTPRPEPAGRSIIVSHPVATGGEDWDVRKTRMLSPVGYGGHRQRSPGREKICRRGRKEQGNTRFNLWPFSGLYACLHIILHVGPLCV